MDNDEKVRENRLRRMAKRQGLELVKSRRRDPRAYDFGAYWLVKITGPGDNWRSRELVAGGDSGMSLDDVERALLGA